MRDESKLYSEKECLEVLQQVVEKLDKSPTMEEYRAVGLSPSPETISDRCGTWRLALAKLGLDPPSREQYTEKDCIQALQNFFDAHEAEPTISSYEQSGFRPAATTIAEKCGSWSEAKEIAGVIDNDDEDLSVEQKVDQTFELLDQAEPAKNRE